LVRKLEKFINHRADMILTSSIQARRLLKQSFKVGDQKIQPLPDCVDLSRFDPFRYSADQKSALRARLNIPEDHALVVYLGLLTDYQGIPHIIEAASHLMGVGEKVHFLIMGFPNINYYKELAKGYGVSDVVTFTGKIPYDDAPFFLSLGDIAITAKQSATEGSGKLLNYMALGLPVVAYDTPVHREYLGDAGSYVAPGETADLAHAISRLAKHKDEARLKGNLLRERVSNLFTWRNAARQIDSVYETLCEQGDSAPRLREG
ncbi:MAG: glycosyltransferase family 4 protein, partial [Chloroflexota bacterium]